MKSDEFFQFTVKQDVTGGGGGGGSGEKRPEGVIKKKKKREASTISKKKKKNRQARLLKEAEKLANDPLAPIELEKKHFTKVKDELNRLVKLGHRDEHVIDLHKEIGPLYQKVIALYEALFSERAHELTRLQEEERLARESYDSVKRKLIKIVKEAEAQNKEGIVIVNRWITLKETPIVMPVREKETRLSSSERRFLRDQATLYKSLYDDATSDIEAYSTLRTRTKKYTKYKAELKARKDLLGEELNTFEMEGRRLKAQFRTFKSRNKVFIEPFENLLKNSEPEIEQPLIMEVEAEDVSELSETEESLIIMDRMTEIREKLIDGNFTTLHEEFNTPYQEFFLDPLIRMYERKQIKAIQEVSPTLISLLIDPRSEVIVTLYHMIIGPPQEKSTFEQLVAYLNSIEPPIEIENMIPKLQYLLKREPLLIKHRFLDALSQFIYDSGDIEEVMETEENPSIVQLISSTETGDMEIIDHGKSVAAEAYEAEILLSPYQVIDASPITKHSSRACIYRVREKEFGTPLIVKVSPYKEEESYVHQLLARTPGFVQLEQLFEMAHFPSDIFTSCNNVKHLYNRVSLFVMQDVPLTFNEVTPFFNDEDKFCLLYELLEALRIAKLTHGIEYNNLNLANIRFLESEPRLYAENGVECHSHYRVTLIDFGFASLGPDMLTVQRKVLAHDDLNAFSRLINHENLQISPQLTDILNTVLLSATDRKRTQWPDNGIPFTHIMNVISKETHKQ